MLVLLLPSPTTDPLASLLRNWIDFLQMFVGFKNSLICKLNLLPLHSSDHYAGWLLVSNCTVRKVVSFKFFNFLIRHRDSLKIVHSVWTSVLPYSTNIYRLCKKLKALKGPLRTLTRSSYSNIHSKVASVRETLLKTQLLLLKNPFDVLIQAEKDRSLSLAALVQIEEA